MNAISEWLMPAEVLVSCLNVALASCFVCTIALVLSRRSTWSLPARHAMLVAALAVSLLAPAVLPLFRPASNFSIRISGTFDQPMASLAALPIPDDHRHGDENPPASASTFATERAVDRPPLDTALVVAPLSEVPDAASPRAAGDHFLPAEKVPWFSIIGSLLCAIWFAGIVVGFVRAMSLLLKLRRWDRSVSIADGPMIAAAADQAREALGLKTEVKLYRSSLLPAPITLGLFRARIVVPMEIESNLSFDQLFAVIQHEMAHIARRDLWIGLLQQVVRLLYWWNPLVRIANRQVADLREQICDDIATRELADPKTYAATLIDIAERCSRCMPVPATLGIGSSPVSQLENRIRRIVSSSQHKCFGLRRRAAVGVLAATVLMTATIMFAQIRLESSKPEETKSSVKAVPSQPDPSTLNQAQTSPSVRDLIERMAAYEKAYLPFQLKVMETLRMTEGLSPKVKASYPWADGRKHQDLMEYAQVDRGTWRKKETSLIDGVMSQWHETFSNGKRSVQVSANSNWTHRESTLEYYVRNDDPYAFNYLWATPTQGVYCLACYQDGGLFSEAFRPQENQIELTWDQGDAKLSCTLPNPHEMRRFVLWLSRDHDWHPVRMQRYLRAAHKAPFSEWEATQFVQRGKQWRVAEGTVRYRDLEEEPSADSKFVYSTDFKVLEEAYGNQVSKTQFQILIPEGAPVRTDQRPVVERPVTKTREITVRAVDPANRPIPKATVRLRDRSVPNQYDLTTIDQLTTDEQGAAHSAKAPAGDVHVEVEADGFRPASVIQGGGANLKLILVPASTGVTVDEKGNPIGDVWIPNRQIHFRADGLVSMAANHDRNKAAEDWSNADGQYELKTHLNARTPQTQIPLIAIEPSLEKLAIDVCSASELGTPRKLVLRPVCHVKGSCLLEQMKESADIGMIVETSSGVLIGYSTTKQTLTPDGLLVTFELRVPPGEYILSCRQTLQHSGFTIPVTVSANQKELELGTKKVALGGTAALVGKPAPPLDVLWRDGEKVTWEKLRGEVVILDFWGAWRFPRLADELDLTEIRDQFRDKPVKWVSIYTSKMKSFEEFDRQMAELQERQGSKRTFGSTAVIDQPPADEKGPGKTSRIYGIVEWPAWVVIDRKGNVVGAVTHENLAATIQRLLE